MQFIDITIPESAFIFLMRNTASREDYTRGNPLYVLYYRHKNGAIGSVTLTISNLATLASQCKWKSYREEKDFMDYYLPSLRGIPYESNRSVYRWRTTI